MTAPSLSAVAADLGAINGCTIRVGHQRLAEHEALPRIVWVPVDGELRAPLQNEGPGKHTVRVDVAAFEAHVWAADEGAVRELMHAMVGRMHLALTARAYTVGRVRWPNPGAADSGLVAVLSAAILLPVNAAELGTATVRTVQLGPAAMTNRMGTDPQTAIDAPP